MATPEEPYPWVRQSGESSEAYDAFRKYLYMGERRSLRTLAANLKKSERLINNWSASNGWQARLLAYDQHMETAATDGHADEMRRVRTRHIELSERLLALLDDRLSDFERTRTDPTVRWTQAFVAATKAQESALKMRDNGPLSGQLERALELLERLENAE
jgi:hypothetical protein